MALDGYFYVNVGNHWRLQIEWDCTNQSISGNYSDITARMYWIGLDSASAVYSDATKTSAIQYNGNAFSTESYAGMARLSPYQKKEINSYSFRIYHNTVGEASFSLDGYFDAEVTLSGTFYGRIDMPQRTFTLNTIPRASSISSSLDFIAGRNLSVSIDRASTRFTHSLFLYVNGILVTSAADVGTSYTFNFSTNDFEQIFGELEGHTSRGVQINIETWDNGTFIGEKDHYGYVTPPAASDINAINGLANNPSNDGYHQWVYIDQTLELGITRSDSKFTHTVEITCGSFSKTFTNVGTGITWTPTQAEMDSLYQQMPNANNRDGNIRVWTYYNGILVRSYTDSDINYYVRNSDPTFDNTRISYADVNQNSLAISGNDQYIIQNMSELMAYVNIAAAPQNYATMSHYVVNIGGKEEILQSATTGSINMGLIDSGVDQTLLIKAVDSRGNTTNAYLPVTMVPYTAPEVVAVAERVGSFETNTVIETDATFSPLVIDGVNKNDVLELQYRSKLKESTNWSTWTAIPFTITAENIIIAENVVAQLENTQEWNVQVQIKDTLNTVSFATSVSTGNPILFIDPFKRAMGFNDFPQNKDEFVINGRIRFGTTLWGSNVIEEALGGAMDLNNSDIMGLNGLFFRDIADNDGEGLQWLKSGAPQGSTDPNDYYTMRMDGEGNLRVNGYIIGIPTPGETLWSGEVYPNAATTINIPRRLSECPNGWMFVWSDYDAGAGANNFHFNYTFVSRRHGIDIAGGGTSTLHVIGTGGQGMTVKTLFVGDDYVTGADDNHNTANGDDSVLRYIFSF